MEVTMVVTSEGNITAQVSLAAHCLVNPKISISNGKSISNSLTENLMMVQKLLNRKNYLEVILAFAPFGIEVNDAYMIDTFVPMDQDGEIYGVAPDGAVVQLLSPTHKVEMFNVMDDPPYEIAEEFRNFYSSRKLNMRDAVSYYPMKMSAEVRAELAAIEKELSIRSQIFNWVSNRKELQPLGLDLTIDSMVDRLDHIIGSEKIFAACWHNEEKFTNAVEIPVIQKKVLPNLEREYIPYYIYMFNLMLNKQDDNKVIEQLYTVRYLLGHRE